MAQKHKTFKRQAEATRLLKTLNATRRKSGRAGITVTGEFKSNLRGRQDPNIVKALKFTAETALDESEKLYEDLIERSENVEDKITQKMMKDYLTRYSENIQSLNRAVNKNYLSLRVANRLEDVYNYTDAAYKIMRNPEKFFDKKKWGAISGILNNLMGSYSRNIPPNDLKKLCTLGEELGLNELSEMDRVYSEYDNLLRNSDQMGQVLVDASDKLRAFIKTDENFIKEHKQTYKKFTELASQYGLW